MLLLAALLLSKVIGQVPLAALAGVLMVTAWRMNEWHTIRFYIDHRLKHAIFAFFITLVATVVLDLTQAILIGFGISTLIFMAQMSELQISRKPVDFDQMTADGRFLAAPNQNVAVYYLSGPLFFAAARRLLEFVESHDEPSATLILSIRGVPLIDATGVEVVRELLHRQRHGGGDVLLTSMDERVRLLLERAGVLAEIGVDHVFWSADKAISALGATMRSETITAVSQPPVAEGILLAPFAEKMNPQADFNANDPMSLPIKAVMRTDVVHVSPDTPTEEIVTLLLQKGYRSLPVVAENGRLLGIITDGDLLRRAGLSTRLDKSAAGWQEQLSLLSKQTVSGANLMTAPVITLSETDTLRQAIEIMTQHHLKRLPVVSENGRLTGWVSRVDILRVLEEKRPYPHTEAAENELPLTPKPGLTIAELMYRDVPTVRPEAGLEEIVQALEKNRRRRAVVVDENQHVLGIITDGDLLRRVQPATHSGLTARLRGILSAQPGGSLLPDSETAATLMTTPVITIPITAKPEEALPLMLEHGIKRIPVVDENGRLAGILGRSNLLQGLVTTQSAN